MREKGYHNTGLRDLLKATGIPKGSFYNFFKNKEEFAIKALVHYTDTMLNHMKRYTHNKSLTPLERLRRFYLFTIEVNQNEDCRKGCLINNFSVELGGLSDLLAQASNQQYGRLVAELTRCIQEGQENGEIIRSHRAEELAEFLHNTFFGSLSRTKMARSTEPMELNLKLTFDFLKA